MSTIEIRDVYKIFGSDPQGALAMVREGADKETVRKETGHTVGLSNVSLTMEAGRTFVVMGLSGSGKSTLIRHLNRLIEPTAGEIWVDDVNVLELSGKGLIEFRRHRAAMVFQKFGLLPHRNVLRNVGYGLAIQGVPRREWEAKARHWIEVVGLKGYEKAYPKQLSGGMQQRVGLARALATDADILLMDEAFSALDPLIRTEMQDELIRLQRELHKTIVFITHDLDEALRLGDRIAILRDGEVVQVGGPQEIVLEPADDYVRDFVRNVNRSRVLTAETVMAPAPEVIAADTPAEAALNRLEADDEDYAYVVDGEGRVRGIVTAVRLERAMRTGTQAIEGIVKEIPVVRTDQVVEDCIEVTAACRWPVPVVDEAGGMRGVLSPRSMMRGLTAASDGASIPRPAGPGA